MSEHQKIGPYDVLEDLGEGSFGPVVSGREGPQGRPVAIKVCALEDSDLRERFLREARAAAKLQHPNIAATLAVGTVGSMPYLAQELVSGPSLGEILEIREERPLAARLDDLLMIARGLDYADRQGIWHGDLTPNNIRRGEQGLKILDFGTARLASAETRLTQKGVTVESASYLPPEQVRGGELDHRVDLFSLGVLAFEILTHERPFRGKTLSALVYQILYKDPVDILSVWPECPPALEALIRRCLSKEPDQRHGSVAEALAELEAIRGQAGAGPVKPPASIPAASPVEEVETTKPIATLGRRPGDPVDTRPVVARPHETVRMQQLPDEEEQISTTMPLPTMGGGKKAPAGPPPRPAAARPTAPTSGASDPQKTQRIQAIPEGAGPPPLPNPQKTQRVSIPDPAAKPVAPAPPRPAAGKPSAPPKAPAAPALAAPKAPEAPKAPGSATSKGATPRPAPSRPVTPPPVTPPPATPPPATPRSSPSRATPSPPGSELPTVTLGKAASAGAVPPASKSSRATPPASKTPPAPPPASKAPPAAPGPSAPSAAPTGEPKSGAAGVPPKAPVGASKRPEAGPPVPAGPPPAPPVAEAPKAKPSPGSVDPEIPTMPMGKAAPAPKAPEKAGPPQKSPSAPGRPPVVPAPDSERPADLVTSAHEISQLVAKGNLQEAMAQLETIRSQQDVADEAPKKPSNLADATLGGPGAEAPAERAPEERTLSREAVAAPPTRHRAPRSGPPVWMLVSGGLVALLAVVAIGWFLVGGGSTEEPEEAAIPEPPKPRIETPADLAAAPPPMGQVLVDAVPWGEIVEITNRDGYLLDLPEVVQTPTSLSLEPGLYRIQVAKENVAEPSECEVDVLLYEPVECRVSFPAPSALEYFKDTGWWK